MRIVDYLADESNAFIGTNIYNRVCYQCCCSFMWLSLAMHRRAPADQKRDDGLVHRCGFLLNSYSQEWSLSLEFVWKGGLVDAPPSLHLGANSAHTMPPIFARQLKPLSQLDRRYV